jgi:gliding motility-associated-like protein
VVARYSILILLFFQGVKIDAQRQADNWVFGTRCYVNFSSGQPVPTNQNPYYFGSGASSMSDAFGNLLFYSNGRYVYNKMHLPMVGGNSTLFGYNGGVSKPVLAVPFPGHDSLYYLFYVKSIDWDTPILLYAIINMNRQNGLGEVVAANQVLLGGDSICQKFTATLHCNKKDIWLVGHKKNSNQYYSLLITSNGISTTPVYSPGIFINESNRSNGKGYMKASPLGDRLAAAYMEEMDIIELSDFNSQTGQITNPKVLTTHPTWTFTFPNFSGSGAFGIEFSPTGKYLYTSAGYNSSYGGLTRMFLLNQFDISSNVASTIQASKVLIDSCFFQEETFAGMQMANDGKIYVSSISNYLHAINNPEGQGLSCNFVRRQVNTGIGTYSEKDLPVFIQSYFRYPIIATGNCQFQNINFSIQNPIGVSSVIWDFGDPVSGVNNSATSFNTTHIYSTQGIFYAKAVLINSNGCGADTITKLIHAGEFKVFLGNDTTICQGDTLSLKMKIPAGFNLWNSNSTDTMIKVTQSGIYWVKVNLGDCNATDSIHVTVRPKPVFSLGADSITICNNESLTLAPNPVYQNVSYLWSNGSGSSTLPVTTNGLYWLSISDAYNCSYRDSVFIQYKQLPNFSLGSDTALCQANLQLNAYVNGATAYHWNTAAITSAITVNQTGIYWADVTRDNCTYRDSIIINFKPYPIVSLGSDTTLCESIVISLNAQNAGSQYLWQDNSTSQVLSVNKAGNYFVNVTKDGCSTSDSIFINYKLKPAFTLGVDFGICEGMTVTLKPIFQNAQIANYLWENGSIDSVSVIRLPDIYWLQLTNSCGSKIDSIVISKGTCQVYVPNAFTPNGDGLNEVFRAGFGENVINFKMEVYNRWGQKIFVSDNIKKGWDGRLNGKMQPQGVYIWMIEYSSTTEMEKRMKGTVTLVL